MHRSRWTDTIFCCSVHCCRLHYGAAVSDSVVSLRLDSEGSAKIHAVRPISHRRNPISNIHPAGGRGRTAIVWAHARWQAERLVVRCAGGLKWGPPFFRCGLKVQDLAKLPLCFKRSYVHHRSHTGLTHFDKMYRFMQTQSINRVVAQFTK